MADTQAAKPQGFMLKMRLVQPDGTPFFSRFFRVYWGEQLIPPEEAEPLQTDRNGALSVLLPAPLRVAPQGEIRLLDRVDRVEVVRWVIPLQIADEPPLFPFPELLSGYVPPPDKVDPSEQAEQAAKRSRYEQDVLRVIRENLAELQRFWGEMEQLALAVPDAPLSSDPDGKLLEAWEDAVFALTALVNGYEAAFRLWNLADLPLPEEPTIALPMFDVQALCRALSRFAYRHGMTDEDGNAIGPALEEIVGSLGTILEHLKKVHDQRGRFGEVRGGAYQC